MTKGSLLAAVAVATLAGATAAQNAGTQQAKYKLFPNDKAELGVHAGVVFSGLDGGFSNKPSYGLGIHLRKALDYTMSIRGGIDFLNVKGTNGTSGLALANTFGGAVIKSTDAKLFSVTFDYLLSLGNSRLESARKVWNPYLFFGLSGGSATVNVTTASGEKELSPTVNVGKLMFAGRLGAGVGYRISDNMTLGIEQLIMLAVGSRSDFLDGTKREGKDIPLYTNIRLGFNLGGKDSKKSAPIWWASPADQIIADINELKARKQYDPADTDGDGVIDAVDQEKESPAGARVDTRGVTLDSDGDKVPDYKDNEPFSPIGYKTDGNGVAQVPKPKYLSEGEVNDIVDRKLAAFKPSNSGTGTATTTPVTGGVADWFLPIVHFDLGSASIKESAYGDLKAIANVLKGNPSLRIVVSGYTDKSGADGANQNLSYRRAQAAIDHISKNYGIDRSRLVLNYAGEATPLVNTSSANFMNRRVEFKVATSESEMSAPAREVKSKKYKGAKNSGY